ncbi:hypothetical protein QR98_0003750 [Sarcoptes scabiei]|uniref:Protein CASC3 n=1 Tax=Sarcoptes scabiei TaxID=52283 RepID=A0A131ZTS6_SARSC|nr:hypothetical protein QR98_0003750 [Sarcoptes scabiei]
MDEPKPGLQSSGIVQNVNSHILDCKMDQSVAVDNSIKQEMNNCSSSEMDQNQNESDNNSKIKLESRESETEHRNTSTSNAGESEYESANEEEIIPNSHTNENQNQSIDDSSDQILNAGARVIGTGTNEISRNESDSSNLNPAIEDLTNNNEDIDNKIFEEDDETDSLKNEVINEDEFDEENCEIDSENSEEEVVENENSVEDEAEDEKDRIDSNHQEDMLLNSDCMDQNKSEDATNSVIKNDHQLSQISKASLKTKAIDSSKAKRNPQYIPRKSTYFEHDDRGGEQSLDDAEQSKNESMVDEDENNNEKNRVVKNRLSKLCSDEMIDEEKSSESYRSNEKRLNGLNFRADEIQKDSTLKFEAKKKSKFDIGDKWHHDKFNLSDQKPKSREELINIYGYDIRTEDEAPRLIRRSKYGKGPQKYSRRSDDENAYIKRVSKRVVKNRSNQTNSSRSMKSNSQDGASQVKSKFEAPKFDHNQSEARRSRSNENDRPRNSRDVSYKALRNNENNNTRLYENDRVFINKSGQSHKHDGNNKHSLHQHHYHSEGKHLSKSIALNSRDSAKNNSLTETYKITSLNIEHKKSKESGNDDSLFTKEDFPALTSSESRTISNKSNVSGSNTKDDDTKENLEQSKLKSSCTYYYQNKSTNTIVNNTNLSTKRATNTKIDEKDFVEQKKSYREVHHIDNDIEIRIIYDDDLSNRNKNNCDNHHGKNRGTDHRVLTSSNNFNKSSKTFVSNRIKNDVNHHQPNTNDSGENINEDAPTTIKRYSSLRHQQQPNRKISSVSGPQSQENSSEGSFEVNEAAETTLIEHKDSTNVSVIEPTNGSIQSNENPNIDSNLDPEYVQLNENTEDVTVEPTQTPLNEHDTSVSEKNISYYDPHAGTTAANMMNGPQEISNHQAIQNPNLVTISGHSHHIHHHNFNPLNSAQGANPPTAASAPAAPISAYISAPPNAIMGYYGPSSSTGQPAAGTAAGPGIGPTIGLQHAYYAPDQSTANYYLASDLGIYQTAYLPSNFSQALASHQSHLANQYLNTTSSNSGTTPESNRYLQTTPPNRASTSLLMAGNLTGQSFTTSIPTAFPSGYPQFPPQPQTGSPSIPVNYSNMQLNSNDSSTGSNTPSTQSGYPELCRGGITYYDVTSQQQAMQRIQQQNLNSQSTNTRRSNKSSMHAQKSPSNASTNATEYKDSDSNENKTAKIIDVSSEKHQSTSNNEISVNN